MAFADGELQGDELARFQEDLARDPALAQQVVEYRRLALLARSAAPAEPMDHEWARIAADPWQRAAVRLGAGLLLFALIGVSVWTLVLLLRSELGLFPKLSLLAAGAGFVLLLSTTLRARLRTLPYDPYTKVER
jgi:anti-sigma factor RsiW